MRKLHLFAALLAVAAASSATHGQRARVHDVPRRPTLWADADTNNANVYYLWALQRVETDPVEAAAGFYWAERLNPGWPDALYGRRMALLMSNPQRLVDYVEAKGFTRNDPELLAIDSLVLRASQRKPFLYTSLEKPFWLAYFRTAFRTRMIRATGSPNDADVEYFIQSALADTDPGLRAWHDYAAGRFPIAAQGYERAVRNDPRSFELRLQLGNARYMAGDYRGAATAIGEAITHRRENDRRQIVRLYESKAVLEFRRGTALEEAGDTAAAGEAYARALQEDLAFWPVHRLLAGQALERGDTATAVAEMALAVELAPAEADLRYEHGILLIQAHKPLDGVAELNKAVELNPHYAAPHWLLALLNDRAQLTVDATEHYRHFVDRAPRDDERVAQAKVRLAELAAIAPAP